MPITSAIGEQVIEAVVAGPDGANRLFTITGAADVCIRATRQQGATETWTFLVGPILTRLQFHRAIATASVASQIVSAQTAPREFTINVHSVEADWDDEDQRVKVRVEIGLISNGTTVEITQVRYWVAILAQMWTGRHARAKFYSRSHATVIRVYGEAGNVIETHEHNGDFKEWWSFFSLSSARRAKRDPSDMVGYDTNLAAEFYTLSVLYRLGAEATLTLGNKKSVDIIVVRSAGDTITVNVKGLAGKTCWPVGNVPTDRAKHFVVFVSFLNRIDDPSVSPEVYVVPAHRIPNLRGKGGCRAVHRSTLRKADPSYRDGWKQLL